ncbi:MAG: chemotaxis protein CheW [Myxococcales bacterium]
MTQETMREARLTPREEQVELGEETEALLTFRVGSALLGVPAELVQEVTDRGEASPIPLAPKHVVGLMPLRGEAIPLVDMNRFLSVEAQASDVDLERPPRVLVVAAEGMVVGLCCERVMGIEHVPLLALAPPRIHAHSAMAPYVTAEADRDSSVLARLNLGALLKAARVSA